MPFYNLMQKSDKSLYSGACSCGCGAILTSPNRFSSLERAKQYLHDYKLVETCFPKIIIDDSWKKREQSRFDDGVYVPPVWCREKWWLEGTKNTSWYAHVAVNNVENLAYTETPEKGMLDTQTLIAPGRFLHKYFKEVLTKDQIEKYANMHRESWANDLKLQWAMTPEQIEYVYTMPASFSSCMQKTIDKTWPGLPMHPTAVYGAGDLGVAYITHTGRLIARAVVWRDRKKVGRVYGDGSRLRNALKEEGINTASNNEAYDFFDGAKLLKVPYKNGFIGPYIDGHRRVKVVPDDEYLYIDPQGPIIAGETNGTMGNYPRCAVCGGQNNVIHAVLTYDSNFNVLTDRTYCRDHAPHHAFQDPLFSRWVDNSLLPQAMVLISLQREHHAYFRRQINYTVIIKDEYEGLEYSKVQQPAGDNSNYRRGSFVFMYNGEKWSTEYAYTRAVIASSDDGRAYYPHDMVVEVAKDVFVTKEYAEKHYITVDGQYYRRKSNVDVFATAF